MENQAGKVHKTDRKHGKILTKSAECGICKAKGVAAIWSCCNGSADGSLYPGIAQKGTAKVRRIWELDFARVIAMLAVITIHVTSTYIYAESRFTLLGVNAAYWLNQASRFAVPLFILLSGMSLRISDNGQSMTRFLKKRLKRIGLPYIFWFFIYDFYNYGFNLRKMISEKHFLPGLKAFFLGQAAPHLYFIIVLLQLYLLYPILKRALARFPTQCITFSLIISFVAQCIIHFSEQNYDLMSGPIKTYLWILFPPWLFYYVCGMALAERVDFIRKAALQNKGAILAITAVFMVFYVLDSHVSSSIGSIKPALIPMTALVFVCAFSVWNVIGGVQIVQKTVSFFAKHSMTIYFVHVLVLLIFRRIIYPLGGMAGMALLFICTFAGAVMAAVVIDAVVSLLVAQMAKYFSGE